MHRGFFHFISLLLLSSVVTPAFSALPFLKIFIATTHANCPHAAPTNALNFCPSFQSVAQCHCTSAGLPSGMCRDVNAIYNRMITVFGSQLKACQYQRDTSVQECMDDWDCYRLGGKDSFGRLCSGTGKAC